MLSQHFVSVNRFFAFTKNFFIKSKPHLAMRFNYINVYYYNQIILRSPFREAAAGGTF